jgi:hypothetical protein
MTRRWIVGLLGLVAALYGVCYVLAKGEYP